MLVGRDLDVADRTAFTARRDELRRALVPVGEAELIAVISGLLMAFPGSRVAPEEAAMVVAVYAGALRTEPLWAIQDAAAKWTRGQVEGASKTFAPSSAELASAASQEAQPLRSELVKLVEILEAKVVASEKRHSLDGLKAKLGDNWGLNVTGGKPPPKRTPEDIQDNLDRLRDTPVEVSPELASKFTSRREDAA